MADPDPAADPPSDPPTDPPADPPAGDPPNDLSTMTPEQLAAALKDARREAGGYRRKLRDTEAQLEAKDREGQTEQERAIADAVKARETELTTEHRRTLVRLHVKAVAAAKFADPDDATRFVDLEQFDDVDDDKLGTKIGKALDELLEAKPYLAREGGAGGGGGGDGLGLISAGARGQGGGGGGKDDANDWVRKQARAR